MPARAGRCHAYLVDRRAIPLHRSRGDPLGTGTSVRLWDAVRVLRIRRPTSSSLADVAREHAESSLTYNAVGATLSGGQPDGYVHDDESVALGDGAAVFEKGRQALQEWAAHRGSGMVVSEGARVRKGETIALAAPLPVGTALAVCRIVEVIDEADRYGFAYGTLPLHPEEGEEAFLIERDSEDRVRFRIIAFSKPSYWAARVGRPAARRLQLKALASYLRAMQQAID